MYKGELPLRPRSPRASAEVASKLQLQSPKIIIQRIVVELGKVSEGGTILVFKIITNLDRKTDSAELGNRLAAFENFCKSGDMPKHVETKNLCLNHHKALTIEVTVLRKFFDSIPEA